jgi:hypothetical protein
VIVTVIGVPEQPFELGVIVYVTVCEVKDVLVSTSGIVYVPAKATGVLLPEPTVLITLAFALLVQVKVVVASVIFPLTTIPALVPLHIVALGTVAVAVGLGLI